MTEKTTAAAIILAVGGVLAAAVTGGLALLATDSDTSSPPPNTTTPSVTPTSSPIPAPAPAKIKEPADGTRISVSHGTRLTGTGAPGDLLWIFDLDQDEGYFRASDRPLIIRNGEWEFIDRPIGATSDPVGTKYDLVLIKAGSSCNRELLAAKPNADGDIRFDALPDGCTEADLVSVVKSKD